MKAHVAIIQKGRMRNELVCDYTLSTEYFCSPIAKAIKGNIFIRQYRYINKKFPNSVLISKTGHIIWEDTKIHRKYQYDTSNITMDNKFIFCTILNELYVLVESTFDGKIINVVNLEKFGIKKAYYIEKTENETYLVTSIVDKKIVEINKNSESIFEYCPGEKTMCEPRYVCISKKGNYIISDSKRHYIFEVNKAKKIRQVWGEKTIQDMRNVN